MARPWLLARLRILHMRAIESEVDVAGSGGRTGAGHGQYEPARIILCAARGRDLALVVAQSYKYWSEPCQTEVLSI